MWTGIALFYFACLAFGFLFALLGAIFGEILGHGGMGLGGHADADLGHGVEASHDIGSGSHAVGVGPAQAGEMPGANVLNTITVSVFLGFFGLSGLVAVWGFGLGLVPSLAVALPTALVLASGQFLLYVKVFIQAQASSEATMAETLGCEAEVITTVPADRVGEIAYVIKGARYSSPAASADGQEIPMGTRVLVVNVRGATLMVRPI